MNQIDTLNKFAVAASGRGIIMLLPPSRGASITPDDALLLAAWLVAIAEHEASNTFEDVLKAVQST